MQPFQRRREATVMDERSREIAERAEQVRRRSTRIADTLRLLQRLLDAPTWQDVVLFHELHAEHEEELGRLDNAARALARARAAAERAARAGGLELVADPPSC
jgi:hypothetical protein